jgi:beta-glucosidase
VSDWGGVHNTEQAIHNGMDLEFGSWTNGLSAGTRNAYDNYYLAFPYLKLIKEGKVGTKELDEKVSNVLRLIFRTQWTAQTVRLFRLPRTWTSRT